MEVPRSRLVAVAVAGAMALALAVAIPAAAGPGKRIVGGTPADPADWPFAAAVYDHHIFNCTGSVIAPDAVLTAGHCVGDPTALSVVVGRPDLSDHSSGERIDVSRARIDPDYLKTGHDDFSVLRLEHATSVAPVTLPTAAEAEAATAEGARLSLAGWGATHPNGGGETDLLMEAETNVIDNAECRAAHPDFARRSDICTRGDPRPGGGEVSACYGDSGGPLIATTVGGPRLVGATSYGGRRCGVRKPTVFARVGDALHFIRHASGL